MVNWIYFWICLLNECLTVSVSYGIRTIAFVWLKSILRTIRNSHKILGNHQSKLVCNHSVQWFSSINPVVYVIVAIQLPEIWYWNFINCLKDEIHLDFTQFTGHQSLWDWQVVNLFKSTDYWNLMRKQVRRIKFCLLRFCLLFFLLIF